MANLAGAVGSFFWDTPGSAAPRRDYRHRRPERTALVTRFPTRTGPGTHALFQTFVVAPSSSVFLNFDMFVNDYGSGPTSGGQGLNHVGAPSQFGRVDILGGSVSGPFDTGAGVLATYYNSVDAGVDPHAFTSYGFDITGVVGGGGTFILRFAATENVIFLNMGVDDVSVRADSAIPEPGSLLLPEAAAPSSRSCAGADSSARKRLAQPTWREPCRVRASLSSSQQP